MSRLSELMILRKSHLLREFSEEHVTGKSKGKVTHYPAYATYGCGTHLSFRGLGPAVS